MLQLHIELFDLSISRFDLWVLLWSGVFVVLAAFTARRKR
jgi:hypothetical protein